MDRRNTRRALPARPAAVRPAKCAVIGGGAAPGIAAAGSPAWFVSPVAGRRAGRIAATT
jgi:hypothetical protein